MWWYCGGGGCGPNLCACGGMWWYCGGGQCGPKWTKLQVHKWNKKAPDQLEKLDNDCNRTSGLEAKLSLAVGARVMLCRNINTKRGLTNGVLGTVLSIASNHVTVQFDHVSEPYDVRMVKSRFMVMKIFFVYRKQFPLILAYAVTTHK